MGTLARLYGGSRSGRGGGGTLARYQRGGGGGGGAGGRERLDSAVGRAEDTGDSGLLGFAKDIADKVGLDSAGNAVMRGLEIADYGRAAVAATGMEGLDALSALTGGEGTTQNTDRVRQTGVSFSDIAENTRNRVGFGDYIEADERTEDAPIWLKRAMGLVGDVGADPLTYLTFGASAVAKGGVAGTRAARGGRVALSSDDVAESLIKGGDTASAERVLSSRSAAAAPREALEAAGVDAGAMFAGRWRVRPLDGVYGTMSRATGRVRRVAADQIANRVKPETWAKIERVPGVHAIRSNPRLRSQGVANVKALEWALGWRDAGTSARNLRREYGDRLNDLARQFGDADRGAITRALEAEGAVVPGSEEFRSFFDDVAGQVEEVTGVKVPRLKNYVSHVLTDEAKAALRRPGQASPAGGRANPFLQHRGRKGTIEEINAEFMEDAYDASRNRFGSRVDKLFKDDPFEIAKSYLDQVERFVRTRAFERAMQDAGLFHYFNEKAIKKVLKGNKKRYKKITRATARQGAAQANAEDVDAQRRAVEGYIEREPFEDGPRGARARDTGDALAEQEELVGDLAEQDQELADEFTRLAEERQALQASERAAIEDPNETIARAETERADLEAGRERAVGEQEAARAEVAELREGGLAAAAEEVAGARVVDRLDRIIAEAERRDLGPQKLDFLRNLARQERGQTLRSKSREQIASLATKIEEGMGLRQAAQDADLAARITAARRRVSAAGARARRAEKAIEKRLNTIEESQAILETQYAVKGDLTPLLEQNRARMDELRARQRETAKGLRKEHARELAVRQQFEKLTAQAAGETDPRLKIHANLEAQAQLGYAEAMRHGWEADANLRGLRRITPEDYRLFEMAASDQITRINRHANLWADPETAEAFLRLKEALKPEAVGGILRLHDKLMSRWKAYALLSPGYHVRNTYGGMFMNAVAGYTGGPAGYLRYATFARNVRKHGADEALNRIKDPEVRAAYTTLWQNRGSVLGGAVGTDLADALGGNPGARGVLGDFARRRGANLDPTALDFAPLNVNRRIGEGAEHLLRGPLYVDSLLKGMSPQQAYARVVRFHFDYSNLSGYGLSEFERNIMRRAVPFYSWMRLNFPVQLEYMIRNPGVYTRYNHAVQNLEHGTEEEQFVPSWIGELGGFAAPATTPGGDQIYVAPDMPHLRVGQTFDVDQMLATLSPIIKTPMEMNSGERFFSNIPFKDEYTPVPTTWLPMAPFLEVAGGKLGLPRVTREGTNYYFDNEAELYKAEQALPLLGRMRRLVPNTDADQEKAFRSWLGFIGFNVIANTPKQQENEMISRSYEIEDLVDAWERRNALGEDEAE